MHSGWCMERWMVHGGVDGEWRDGWCMKRLMVHGETDGA